MGRSPASTYRLQIRADFDLDAATAALDHLHRLGADWVYLSPLLTATAGSDHGYDVVDPTVVDPARGGSDGLKRLADAAHARGMGVLVDIVPNHMGVAAPEQNAWWWDVLRRGRGSRYAEAFDIDWDAGGGRVRLPLLGAPLDEAIADITVDRDAGVVRYFDHALPLAEGTPDADVREVLRHQHWEAVYWRDEATLLNYRRFFTVTGLAGVRVEESRVFDQTHVEVRRWVEEGLVDGLRIDHPDGLADPGGYLADLAEITHGAYVVVEKILEPGEELPPWWDTDGTTGYDALAEVDRVLTDPAGEAPLAALEARLSAETGLEPRLSWHRLVHDRKLANATGALHPEVARLARCLVAAPRRAPEALAELLACFPVYRSYPPVGAEHVAAAAAEASAHRPDLADVIDEIVPQLLDPASEASRRFAQTAGPVMAKGVEDSAFYRWTRLTSLTEVGGDPSHFALDPGSFHAARERRQSVWPHTMTALSTHDTKRSEDVRARLAVISELPDRWADVLERLRAAGSTGHGPFDALVWQAIVGAWPASRERLRDYAVKAARESGEMTTWIAPDATFEARVEATVDAAFDDPATAAILEEFVDEISPWGWSNALSAKLLQLTGPGVPDVYQGTESWDLSLVDPDNRRPVDFAALATALARVDAGERPAPGSGDAKVLVTSRALRLRRDRPDLFTRYTPMWAVGPAADHVLAYDRGGALAAATRLPAGLAASGGWGETMLLRQSGPAVDVLTGRRFDRTGIPLADLFADYPVALLRPLETGVPG
ncbi:malto-oligosyltrehalose synthase [Microbacterium awajiense]|uniref:Malto-oligosyltrehalose synthase n=1 Tax=Microbacterium awajiense TaxID=415214 RepID=A0ABP7A8I3_9MICO